MVFKEYLKLACKELPELNLDKIPNLNKIECLRIVSMTLFTTNECNTPFAKITRGKIKEYWKNGYIKEF